VKSVPLNSACPPKKYPLCPKTVANEFTFFFSFPV